MNSFLNKMEQKEHLAESENYTCNICDFVTSRKFNFNKHCSTKRHILNHFKQNLNEKIAISEFSCKNCNKIYKNRSGLWHHNNKCLKLEKESPKNYEEIVMNLLTQNIELQKQVIELCKEKSMIINNNSHNTTNNNQKFNMNFFLNDQCKDALDIMEFVNSIKISLSDLENTGKVGYVKGISDIFLRNLRELDVYKRPIHCSDLKREVMYIKDNDVWEKDQDKKKVKKAIQHIAGKNFKQIKEWTDLYPDSKDVKTKKHDQYIQILSKCTGGINSEEDNILYNKIITNVAKEVIIDR